MISFIELNNSSESLEILERFYNEYYVFEFPDPDERESLENMRRYLNLKAHGWYGNNNYHILIVTKGKEIIGGSITDFLAAGNAGVIEFLFVAPSCRMQGIGAQILQYTENLLLMDAQNFLGENLDLIVAEMNDPLKPDPNDNLDAVIRSNIWTRWGYSVLRFPYIQPALSLEQEAVDNLVLITKIFNKGWQTSLPSKRVKIIVHEYLRWAMRIEQPDSCQEFAAMASFFDNCPRISVSTFSDYIAGIDRSRQLD